MWLAALLLGMTGSLHCVGMCSPLVLAVSKVRQPAALNRLLYNGGRIFTYCLLGASISVFGSLFNFSSFQNGLSIALGILCIVMGIVGVQRIRVPLLSSASQTLTIGLKNVFGKMLAHKSWLSISILGMLNGLLPCGLTALALSNCVLLPTAADGFLFMLLFGAGTLPVMLGLVSVIQKLTVRFNFGFRHLAKAGLIALGLLLISRSFYVHPLQPSPAVAEGQIEVCR